MMETVTALAALLVPLQSNAPAIPPKAAAAIAVGLAAFGAGYAERGIGAAAVGAVAEDDEMFGRGLILTVLPETLVILALVVVFVVPEIDYSVFAG
ncbi:MAG: F0F1 ATP synthase subunit C [Haloarculaceae archaeon]|jgi:V/A-type H+-transporting ATPase subunit K